VFLVAIEIFLKVFSGVSLCPSDGCEVVSNAVGAIEFLLLASGLAFFLVMLGLESTGRWPTVKKLLLVAAVVTEGYLIAFQFFTLQEVCFFCMVVALLVVGYAVSELLREKTAAVAFGAALSVFLAGAFVNNPVGKHLPADGQVLIFSENCPHCLKVLQFIKDNNLNIRTCNYTCQAELLARLGIDEVPVLVISPEKQKKEIYVGVNNIIPVLARNFPPAFKMLPLKDGFVDDGSCHIDDDCNL